MKRHLLFALALVLATGCSSTIQKNFKVVVDPPDADIRVIAGENLKEEKYRSPADVSAGLPAEPAIAAKARMEVSRESYKSRTIALRNIKDGDTITVKLEKIVQSLVHYHLKYRMIGPSVSEEIKFSDRMIAVQFTVDERRFQMKLDNLAQNPLKILWDQAEYRDVNNRSSRLMHPGIPFQDRNNPLPAQPLPAGGSLQEAVMPVSLVGFSQEKKTYESQPLFPIDSDAAQGLKGRVFYLFIPIEVDRQIIPYNFKIQITEVVKEAVAPR